MELKHVWPPLGINPNVWLIQKKQKFVAVLLRSYPVHGVVFGQSHVSLLGLGQWSEIVWLILVLLSIVREVDQALLDLFVDAALQLVAQVNALGVIESVFVVQVFAQVPEHLREAHKHVLDLLDGHVVLLVRLFVQVVAQVVPHALLHQSLAHFRIVFRIQFEVLDQLTRHFHRVIRRQKLYRVFEKILVGLQKHFGHCHLVLVNQFVHKHLQIELLMQTHFVDYYGRIVVVGLLDVLLTNFHVEVQIQVQLELLDIVEQNVHFDGFQVVHCHLLVVLVHFDFLPLDHADYVVENDPRNQIGNVALVSTHLAHEFD